MSTGNSAVKAIQEAVDARIKAVEAKRPSTHMAEVVDVDASGTTWVHIFGGAERTPVARTLAKVGKGDLVTVTIEDGIATVNGSPSSPAASTSYVDMSSETVAEYARQAIAGILGDVVQVKEAIVGRATIDQLVAVEATIQDLTVLYENVNELVAGKLSATDAELMYAKIGLENVNASEVGYAKIRELVAGSGWFDDLTVTGDGTITGRLKAVELDGDLARFKNIYADALKILGQDGLYHALNLSGLDGDEAQALVDAYGEELDGALHGSHLIAESVTAAQIDVTSLIAAMLLAQFVQIGATAGTHIEAKGDRLSFFAGGSGWESLTDEYLYRLVEEPVGSPVVNGWYELVDGEYVMTTDVTVDSEKDYYRYTVTAGSALPGEVAYIAVDPTTRESTFYMTRSVVVKDLRFGDWLWYGRRNRNMALKWVGGAE